jgi:hypothetical protein
LDCCCYDDRPRTTTTIVVIVVVVVIPIDVVSTRRFIISTDHDVVTAKIVNHIYHSVACIWYEKSQENDSRRNGKILAGGMGL